MHRVKLLLGAALVALGVIASAAAAPPNDPHYGPYQWGPKQIHAEQAWATSRGAGQVIAIVDSGIDLATPISRRRSSAAPPSPAAPTTGPCGNGDWQSGGAGGQPQSHTARTSPASRLRSPATASASPASRPTRSLLASRCSRGRRHLRGDRRRHPLGGRQRRRRDQHEPRRASGRAGARDHRHRCRRSRGSRLCRLQGRRGGRGGRQRLRVDLRRARLRSERPLRRRHRPQRAARRYSNFGVSQAPDNVVAAPGGAGLVSCADDIVSTVPASAGGTCTTQPELPATTRTPAPRWRRRTSPAWPRS